MLAPIKSSVGLVHLEIGCGVAPKWQLLIANAVCNLRAMEIVSLTYQAVTPALLKVTRFNGKKASDVLLVKLKNHVTINQFLRVPTARELKVDYRWDFINTFAGKFQPHQLYALCHDPNVQEITEDGYGEEQAPMELEKDANWNLARLTSDRNSAITPTGQAVLSPKFEFPYDANGGAGVDIYILGTLCYHVHGMIVLCSYQFHSDTGATS
ncbi:hypothetical protein H0H87_001680 [Tephrocybe sp. NHM501043]|nr:hypothetical protein H0H87_001680 [Tephrocybe sp. NHM501043]